MKNRSIIGITGLVLTLVVMLPVLFLLTRGAVSSNQFVIIVVCVLFLVLWTAVYVTLVDPLLRRAVGALFNVTIEWRGPSNSFLDAHGNNRLHIGILHRSARLLFHRSVALAIRCGNRPNTLVSALK